MDKEYSLVSLPQNGEESINSHSLSGAREALESGNYDGIIYLGEAEKEARRLSAEHNTPLWSHNNDSSSIPPIEDYGDFLQHIKSDSEVYGGGGNPLNVLAGVHDSQIGVTISESVNDDGNRPIIYSNPAFSDITGYESEEVLGHDHRFLQGENTDQDTLDEIRAGLENGIQVDTRILNYTKDGTEFWNQLRISPIYGEDGQVNFWLGYQEDVTDEVRYQKRLETLAEVFEHDFRNSLSVVRGNFQLIENELEDQDIDLEGKEDVINNRLSSMKDSISKLESFRDSLVGDEMEKEFELNQTLSGLKQSYLQEARTNGIELNVHQSEDDVLVKSDDLLDEYFGNIIENSIEHSDGSEIDIAVDDIGNGKAVVYISDDGQGMDTEDGQKGQGMMLIDEIARQNNIEYEIESGEGTTWKSTFNKKDID